MPEQYALVQLDKQRRLRYDLNALAVIQERFGVAALSADGLGERFDETGTVDFAFLRTVIWAGLLHEDAELTEQAVGGMLDLGNMASAVQAFFEAMSGATPEGVDAANPQTAAAAAE